MKKVIKILLVGMFLVTSLISGGCKKDEGTFKSLSVDKLEKKFEDEDDFVLVLKEETSEECALYEQIINEYIDETNNTVYYLTVNDNLLENDGLNELFEQIKNTPSYESENIIYPSTILIKSEESIFDSMSLALSVWPGFTMAPPDVVFPGLLI